MRTRIAAYVHGAGLAVVGAAAGDPLARLGRVAAAVGVVALVLAALRAPTDRWTGSAFRWAALVAVTATEALAATLAADHLAGAGPTVRGLAALAAAIAGLVVLVALVAALWRGADLWRRLVTPIVAVVLLAGVAYPVAVGAHATAQPVARLGDRTPADLGLDHEDVTFETRDGVSLAGWYLPEADGAAVVLLHGASSTRSAVLDHAAVLHAGGYGVLLVDARGHGGSGGDPMDLGWYGEADVVGAVDHLLTRPDVDPDRIGVVGMSMGGEEAIGAAGVDDRIAAVVAEGATNRTFEDKDDWLPGGVAGWVQRRIDAVTYGLVDLLVPVGPPAGLRESAAAAAPRPILVIAGDGEEAAARSIQQGAPGSVEVWESGTGHTQGLADLPGEWERRVLGFLDEALGVREA